MKSTRIKQNNQSMSDMSQSEASSVDDYDLFKLKINSFKYKINTILKIRKDWIREFLAELLGTFIFLTFGLASIAQHKLSAQLTATSLNISFGFSLTIAIIIVGKVSGGHLNPAVSLSMVIMGYLSLSKFFLYIIGQFIGAILASLVVFIVYYDQLQKYPGGIFSLDTASIFATYPNDINDPNIIVFSFLDEFFATLLFIIAVLAITEKKNEIPFPFVAFLIGLCLIVIESSFGFICGCSVNPARDLAPRYFTLIAGWGLQVITAGNYFFWIPIVAPMIGSLFGTIIYHFFIGNNLPQERF